MHHWQDFVLAASFLAFNIALIPSVVGAQKPALWTSIITLVFLVPGLIVYLNLSLWYSAVMTVINILLWGTLMIQVLRKKRR